MSQRKFLFQADTMELSYPNSHSHSNPVACSIFFVALATTQRYHAHWFGGLLLIHMPHWMYASGSQGPYLLVLHWLLRAQNSVWLHNCFLYGYRKRKKRGRNRKRESGSIGIVSCCSIIFEVLSCVLSCLILITLLRNRHDNPHLQTEIGNTYWVSFKHFVPKWNWMTMEKKGGCTESHSKLKRQDLNSDSLAAEPLLFTSTQRPQRN